MGTYSVIRTHFPYCLRRLADGRYIVLNRNYKPLGYAGMDHIDYEAHPSACALKITPAIAAKLSYEGSHELDSIHLYDGGQIAAEGASEERMAAYQERLALLMTLKVEVK